MGHNLKALNLGSDFDLKDIFVGREHSCALAESGKIKCFGSNQWGQCGYGTNSDTLKIGDDLPYVDLGASFNVSTVVTGSTADHSCAISTQNKTKCWGRNDWGQLGIGDTVSRGTDTDQMGDHLPFLKFPDSTEWFTVRRLLIIGGVVLSLCPMLLCGAYCFSKKESITKDDERNLISPLIPDSNRLYISNGLMVVIAIAKYEDWQNVDPLLADLGRELNNLPALLLDVQNLKNLSEFLKFKFMSNDDQTFWTQKQIVSFLKKDVVNELLDDSGNLKYDGLMVFISCHGVKNHIVTSDYKLIDKVLLHRLVSKQNAKVRDIPRIFILDCCDDADPKNVHQSVGLEDSEDQTSITDSYRFSESKSDEIEREEVAKSSFVKPLLRGSETVVALNAVEEAVAFRNVLKTAKLELSDARGYGDWTESKKNPDYKLVFVKAANSGFMAKARNDIGSYFISYFVNKMERNIAGKQGKELAVVLDEIQNELHDLGRQLTENLYNNNTRTLMFKVKE